MTNEITILNKVFKTIVFLLFTIGFLQAENWTGKYASSNWTNISYDIANNALLASMEDGQLYSSTNNGTDWQEINMPTEKDINFPTSENTILSVNDKTYALISGKLFYTYNLGQSWTEISNIGSYVGQVSANNSGKIFISTGNGLMLSINNGLSWSNVGNFGGNLHIDNSGRLFVAAYDFKIYSSFNNGVSWNIAELNYPDGSMTYSTPIGLASSPNDTLFVGSYWDGVLKSVDHGLTWIKTANGLPEGRGVYKVIASSNTKIYAMVGDQIGYLGLYVSTNGGVSWSSTLGSGMSTLIHARARDVSVYGSKIWQTHGVFGTSYRSSSGASWQINGGIIPQNVVSIVPTSTGKLIVGSNDRPYSVGPNAEAMGILSTSNGGLTWSSLNAGFGEFDSAIQSIVRAEDDTIIALPYSPGELLIKKPLENIFKHTTVSPDVSSTFASSSIAKDGTIVVSNYWDGPWMTENNGMSWDRLAGWPQGVSSKMASKSDDGTYYVVRSGQSGAQGLFKSKPNGTWDYIGFAGDSITALLITKDNHIVVSTYGNIYISRDKGLHWENFTNGLESSMGLYDITESCNGTLYIATRGSQIYRYTTTGWKNMDFPVNTYVNSTYSMAILKGYLYVGTNNGVFKTNINSCQDYPIKKELEVNYGALLVPILHSVLFD